MNNNTKQLLIPYPAQGDHAKQIARAREIIYKRYKKAFEELAKL